jgi:Fibronectin type III domain
MKNLAKRFALACAFVLTATIGLNPPTPARAASAPPVPSYLQTAGTDTTTPVLSGVVQDPSDSVVSGEVFLLDSAGNPIGGSPTAVGGVLSGQRITYDVPDGVLTDGSTYQWYMKACSADQSICSGPTTTHTFTVDTAAAPAPITGTASVTISGSTIFNKDADIDPTACSGGPCGFTSNSYLNAGYNGHHWETALKLNLSAIPADSRITKATLHLTRSSCGNCVPPRGQVCPAYGCDHVTIFPADSDVATETTGTQLAASADATSISGGIPEYGTYDITGAVETWFDGGMPNDGMVVEETNESTTTMMDVFYSTRASVSASYLPHVVVTYAPPAAPSQPTSLTVTSGDGGAFASWANPANQGDAAGITGYTVQVVNGSGSVVEQTSVDNTSTVLDGLTDGTNYTIKVAAVNTAGTGPSASASATPVAVSGAANYVQAAQQFLDARDTLRDGQNSTASEAAATASTGAMFSSLLSAEGSTDLAINSATQSEGVTVNSDVNALSNTLVVPVSGVSSVLVYTADDNTFNCVTDAGTSSADTVGCEDRGNYIFTFSTSGTPQLTGYVDGAAAREHVTEATEANAVSTSLNDNPDTVLPAGSPPAGQPLTYTAASIAPAETVSSAAIIYRQGTFNWAYAHLYGSNNGYYPDCTDFASRAMHYGGNDPENKGWYWPVDHTSDRLWAKDWMAATYSWGGAFHLADHLWLNGSYYRRYLANGQTGEIIFANWYGSSFNGIDHTAVLYRRSNGSLMVIQHTRDVFEPLSYWFNAHPGAYVWVVIPNQR